MTYERLTVRDFLDRIARTYATWLKLLEDIEPAQYERPIIAGGWSIKDIIAHITWHEAQMVGVMKARALVGSDWWQLSTAERNANIYAQHKGQPLQDVLDEAKDAHRQLIEGIEPLADEDLNEPGRFADMPVDWLFSDILAQNTYEHHAAHQTSLGHWLTSQDKSIELKNLAASYGTLKSKSTGSKRS